MRSSLELKRLADAVWPHLAGLARGETLTWVAIAELTGLHRSLHLWWSLCRKLRKRLLDERGIAMWPIAGVGLRLLTAKEQVTLIADRRRRRMLRQSRKALNEISAAPVEELSLHNQRLKAFQIERLKIERTELRKSLRMSRPESLPRRPIPQ